jgi:hypothetical protein
LCNNSWQILNSNQSSSTSTLKGWGGGGLLWWPQELNKFLPTYYDKIERT